MRVYPAENHSGVSVLKGIVQTIGRVRTDGVSAVRGSMYRQEGPYNVTGGANVNAAFVLLQGRKLFYYKIKKLRREMLCTRK